MFALKTIQIPLPGRHPPSPILSNGHETPPRPNSSQQTASSRRHSDIFDSFSSLKLKSSSGKKVSPAMNSLQGYYGLRTAEQKGVEMTVYQKSKAHYLEDGPFVRPSPISNPPLSHHRKSRSANNCLASENGDPIDQNSSLEAENNGTAKSIEKLLRRRQKSEADFMSRAPEKLLKEDNTGSISVSAITGKGLALRPKSASRTTSGGPDGETGGGFNPIPLGLGDSFLTDSFDDGVRKSSSASSLQDSDNGALASLWPDFQALSAAAIAMPIFDGLGKPSNRRNKAALD